MTHWPSSCCRTAGSAAVPPSARAESGREVSRVCFRQPGIASDRAMTSVKAGHREVRVPISAGECKKASRSLDAKRLLCRASPYESDSTPVPLQCEEVSRRSVPGVRRLVADFPAVTKGVRTERMSEDRRAVDGGVEDGVGRKAIGGPP